MVLIYNLKHLQDDYITVVGSREFRANLFFLDTGRHYGILKITTNLPWRFYL